jgi:hypothetical protein
VGRLRGGGAAVDGGCHGWFLSFGCGRRLLSAALQHDQ